MNSGRPSRPARAKLAGVPPTPTQTGSFSWTGPRRNVHTWNALGQVALPVQDGVVAEFEEHSQLLVEQAVIVRGVVAEQRVGLDERATAGNDLGAAVGDEVQGGELLEKPDGVLRGQHGHGRAEPEVGGFPGDGREDDFRGREREIVPVVFPQAHKAEARLVRQFGKLNDLLQPLPG